MVLHSVADLLKLVQYWCIKPVTSSWALKLRLPKLRLAVTLLTFIIFNWILIMSIMLMIVINSSPLAEFGLNVNFVKFNIDENVQPAFFFFQFLIVVFWSDITVTQQIFLKLLLVVITHTPAQSENSSEIFNFAKQDKTFLERFVKIGFWFWHFQLTEASKSYLNMAFQVPASTCTVGLDSCFGLPCMLRSSTGFEAFDSS